MNSNKIEKLKSIEFKFIIYTMIKPIYLLCIILKINKLGCQKFLLLSKKIRNTIISLMPEYQPWQIYSQLMEQYIEKTEITDRTRLLT